MATESVIDYMASKGRAPSFNSAGQVRGFRSRPGAPQADTTQNVGALGTTPSSPTPAGSWNQMFRNTKANNYGTAGSNPGYVSSFPTKGAVPAVDTAMKEIMADEQFGGGVSPVGKPATPSLNILAGGGPTHAQAWGGDALKFNDTATTGGTQRTAKSKYGWGSSFLPSA